MAIHQKSHEISRNLTARTLLSCVDTCLYYSCSRLAIRPGSSMRTHGRCPKKRSFVTRCLVIVCESREKYFSFIRVATIGETGVGMHILASSATTDGEPVLGMRSARTPCNRRRTKYHLRSSRGRVVNINERARTQHVRYYVRLLAGARATSRLRAPFASVARTRSTASRIAVVRAPGVCRLGE